MSFTRKTLATPRPDSLDETRYEYTFDSGHTYEVAKQFYAHGPSMFSWVVASLSEDAPETAYGLERKTLKALIAELEKVEAKASA